MYIFSLCLYQKFASIRSQEIAINYITGNYYYKFRFMHLGYLSMTYMLTWKFCPYLSANQRFSCCTLMLFKVQVVSPCIFLVEFTWRLMVWLSIFWMWVLYPLAVISRSTENQKCSQQLYSNYIYTMQMMHSNKNYFIKLLLHFSSFSFYVFPTFLTMQGIVDRH